MATQNTHLDWATWYFRRGFSVVPIAPRDKRASVPWKEFQTRRPTEQEVTAWWHDSPHAGIGLVLGTVSNVFAIDVDGVDAERALIEQLHEIPVAPTSISGSREPSRYHLLFRHPEVDTRAKATPWHPQLEFRGKGGLLILPPSTHPSGNRYEWVQGRSLTDLPLSDPPQAVLDELRGAAERRLPMPLPHTRPRRCSLGPPRIDGISSTTKAYLNGDCANALGWNDATFRAACDLNGCGVPLGEAMPLLLTGAQPWTTADRDKAVATIRSAYSQQRAAARELASECSPAEPSRTWVTGKFVVNEYEHPERRHLPPSATLELGGSQ